MSKKIEKEFCWLKVLHIIEDNGGDVHKLIKTLNKEFIIKERKKINKN
jgi:hypothetical protein